MVFIFITLSSRLLRRGAVQKEIAARRRTLADQDEESRAKQLVLRTGLAPVVAEDLANPADNRRNRVRARRESQATGQSTSESAPESSSTDEQH